MDPCTHHVRNLHERSRSSPHPSLFGRAARLIATKPSNTTKSSYNKALPARAGTLLFSPCAERPGGEQAARPKLVNVFWSGRLDDATGGHVTDHQHIKRLIRHCTPSRIGAAIASVESEPHHLKGCAASSSDLNGELAHVIPPDKLILSGRKAAI
jgi:hypothetical protein